MSSRGMSRTRSRISSSPATVAGVQPVHEVLVAAKSEPTHAIGSCTGSVWIGGAHASASSTGMARNVAACAPRGLGHEAGVGAGARRSAARARRARSAARGRGCPAIPKMVPCARHALATVRTASRNASSRNCPRMPISAVRSCGPSITMSTPGHRRDLVGRGDRVGRLEHHRHHGLRVEGVEQLPLRHRPVAVRGVRARHRPVPARREAARVDDRLGLGAGLDVRHDHAHRADVERAGEVLVVVRGHPHQRRDAGADRGRSTAATWSRARSRCARGRRRPRRTRPPPRSWGCRRCGPASAPCTAPAAPASIRSRIEGMPSIMVGHPPSVILRRSAGTLIPRSAYLKISASRSVASRPTRVTVSTSGDSARSAATVHCSFGRVANGSNW